MPPTSPERASAGDPLVSVVVPAYNESDVLEAFHARLRAVADTLRSRIEVIYVDDGSTDDTAGALARIQSADPRVCVIGLSRNFGKEIAVTAGLDHALGDAVVIIDADLQDPPELIPQLVEEWRAGFDVVYAQRASRSGDPWLKRATAHAFYRSMQHVGGGVHIPENAGDFRLLSRRAVDALKQFKEHHRFMKGLFTWIGYRQKAVSYQRAPREAGGSKWSYWRLWNFAIEGITSFTVTPLKLSTYLGLVTALGAFSYGVVTIVKTLLFGVDIPGYASLMVAILFLGGVQLTALGVIGEYLGRTFNETKRRPLYFVERYAPGGERAARDGCGVADEAG